jgi:hypothetical protein
MSSSQESSTHTDETPYVTRAVFLAFERSVEVADARFHRACKSVVRVIMNVNFEIDISAPRSIPMLVETVAQIGLRGEC